MILVLILLLIFAECTLYNLEWTHADMRVIIAIASLPSTHLFIQFSLFMIVVLILLIIVVDWTSAFLSNNRSQIYHFMFWHNLQNRSKIFLTLLVIKLFNFIRLLLTLSLRIQLIDSAANISQRIRELSLICLRSANKNKCFIASKIFRIANLIRSIHRIIATILVKCYKPLQFCNFQTNSLQFRLAFIRHKFITNLIINI